MTCAELRVRGILRPSLQQLAYYKQGNRRYQTSPALCNRTAPSRPIGRIASPQKFSEYYLHFPGILNDPFCYMTLLAIVNDPFCNESRSDAALTAAAKIANAFNGPDNTRKLSLILGDLHPI